MKKWIALLIAAMLALSSTAALAGEPTDPLANPMGVSPIVKEPLTMTLAVAQNVNVESYGMDNYWTKWVYEHTGITMEAVLYPSADSTTKLDLQVASGTALPDIITFGLGNTTRRTNYGMNGALIPLNDYYDYLGEHFFNYCKKIDLDGEYILKQIKSADGNIYATPYRDNNFANWYSQRAFMNKTWLDKLGLTFPKTSDELVEVLKAFRDQDPNGNGQADEIPLMGMGDSSAAWQSDVLGYLQNMFIYYNNDETFRLPLSETDGKIDVSFDKPEYREFLIYANMLVKEGLLSPLSFTQDNTQYSAVKRSDPAVIGMSITGGAVDLYFGNSPDSYEPFEVCAGPNGAQYQTSYLSYAQGSSGVTADCEHPEIAFMLMNYTMYDDEAYKSFYIHRWGEEGVDWRFAEDGEISMFDMAGYAPRLLALTSTWGTLTNKHWQGVELFVNVCNPFDIIEVFDGNKQNDEYWYAVNYSYNKDHAVPFEDLIGPIAYTEEETDTWTDTRTALKTYVLEARTLFALGQLDPNSDTDWNNYLNELNNLRYKELNEADQIAYDRMMS